MRQKVQTWTQPLFSFSRTAFSRVLISQHVTLIFLQVFPPTTVQTVIVQTSNNFNSARTISRPSTKWLFRCSICSVLRILRNYVLSLFPCLLLACDQAMAFRRAECRDRIEAQWPTICEHVNSDIYHSCFQWFIHLCHAAVLGLNINDALCLLQGHIQAKYGPSNQDLGYRFREQGG